MYFARRERHVVQVKATEVCLKAFSVAHVGRNLSDQVGVMTLEPKAGANDSTSFDRRLPIPICDACCPETLTHTKKEHALKIFFNN
ncbi:MAG: hypothetical protein ACI83P_000530 [Janthinobacterium sp.]